jgi:hypothetical protein
VLDPAVVDRHRGKVPEILQDLVQPYSCFSSSHFSIPAGFYVMTPPGIATLIGPPMNRPGSGVAVLSGLIQTDWHHKELFVVTTQPEFDGRSLLILPEQDLAQLYFVVQAAGAEARLEHRIAAGDTGRAYQDGWKRLAGDLASAGRGSVAVRRGVASISLDCLHCRISVVNAAEGDLPHDHEIRTVFTPGYKVRKQQEQQRRATP